MNQLAGKLGETAGVIVQQGKKILGCNGSDSVDHSTSVEKQGYQEDRRDTLGG